MLSTLGHHQDDENEIDENVWLYLILAMYMAQCH